MNKSNSTMIPTSMLPSTQAQAQAAIAKLQTRVRAWCETSRHERLKLLQTMLDQLALAAPTWAQLAARAKGLDPESNLAGEEWLNGPAALARYGRLLCEQIASKGQLAQGLKREQVGDQVRVQVFPRNTWERAFLPGAKAQLWLEPGEQFRTIDAGTGNSTPADPGVALVLGAGNVSSIAPIDALHKLFVDQQVVLLKLNPINDYLAPVFQQILAPFIQANYLQLVYGGAEIGAFLCQHPEIKSVHITGSVQTHDRIVWGDTEEEQSKRKREQNPRLQKAITSELGCVTPVIIMPGHWPAKALRYQARNVASMLVNNAGFNCAAAKVLITHESWPLRAEFLRELKAALKQFPTRRAYYPGSEERYQEFLKHYPKAEVVGQKEAGCIPWAIVSGVDHVMDSSFMLEQELFCGVLMELPLSAADPKAFLAQAVTFANERLFGSLSCIVLIDPQMQKQYKNAFEQALKNLRYGSVAVNIWSGSLYWLMSTTWGAYPGNQLEQVGSGLGWVHNAFLIEHPQKCILQVPFMMPPPTPSWFSDHKNLRALGEAVLGFELRPSLRRFLRLVAAALKG